MGGGDLNMKKSWHTGTFQNKERVWKHEKAALEERKKLQELQKEREQERAVQELQRLQAEAGGKKREERVDWMYAAPAEGNGPNAEELEAYLLGKKRVDKLLKGNEEKVMAAHTTSNPGGSFTALQNANSARDTAAKIREDPLLAIKRQEQLQYEKLLKNPRRLQELKDRQLGASSLKDGRDGKRKKTEETKEERRARKAAKHSGSHIDAPYQNPYQRDDDYLTGRSHRQDDDRDRDCDRDLDRSRQRPYTSSSNRRHDDRSRSRSRSPASRRDTEWTFRPREDHRSRGGHQDRHDRSRTGEELRRDRSPALAYRGGRTEDNSRRARLPLPAATHHDRRGRSNIDDKLSGGMRPDLSQSGMGTSNGNEAEAERKKAIENRLAAMQASATSLSETRATRVKAEDEADRLEQEQELKNRLKSGGVGPRFLSEQEKKVFGGSMDLAERLRRSGKVGGDRE